MTAPLIENEPRNMTPAEVEATVAWFATLPLKELRRRQDIVIAGKIAATDVRDPSRKERAFADLEAMDNQLMWAIMRQLITPRRTT